MRCVTNVKIRLSRDPEANGFGKGIVQLLEGVERLGSINKATGEMGMAYSKAWRIIRQAEDELGVRLIDRDGAHGSTLTEDGDKLLNAYLAIEKRLKKVAADEFSKRFK